MLCVLLTLQAECMQLDVEVLDPAKLLRIGFLPVLSGLPILRPSNIYGGSNKLGGCVA